MPPRQRHAVRITAKGLDIVPHPAQGASLIEETGIGRETLVAGKQLRKAVETRKPQPVIDRHHDAITAPGKIAARILRA